MRLLSPDESPPYLLIERCGTRRVGSFRVRSVPAEFIFVPNKMAGERGFEPRIWA
jgi:hypothetical protein